MEEVATDPVALAIAKQLGQTLQENARLQKQVTELQEAMSRMVEARLSRRVRTFMIGVGQAVRHAPQVPPEAEVRTRLRLIAEEFVELVVASCRPPNTSWMDGDNVWEVLTQGALRNFIDNAELNVDLPEVADALADLAYVTEGTNATFGIDGDAIMDEVHTANMAKLKGGTLQPDGKFKKPANWQAPDIAAALERQLQRG